jgi:hypothetical protein
MPSSYSAACGSIVELVVADVLGFEPCHFQKIGGRSVPLRAGHLRKLCHHGRDVVAHAMTICRVLVGQGNPPVQPPFGRINTGRARYSDQGTDGGTVGGYRLVDVEIATRGERK